MTINFNLPVGYEQKDLFQLSVNLPDCSPDVIKELQGFVFKNFPGAKSGIAEKLENKSEVRVIFQVSDKVNFAFDGILHSEFSDEGALKNEKKYDVVFYKDYIDDLALNKLKVELKANIVDRF